MIGIKNYFETDLVLVQATDVRKAYDKTVILDGLNLTIRNIRRTDDLSIKQAQIVSILGPSGVGKTTFFNALAGLRSVDSGIILIDNPDILPTEDSTVNDLIPTRKGLVGVVYQDYRLFNFLKVEELLMLGAHGLSSEKKKDFVLRVDEYLESFGLNGERKKMPLELSGGQRQRVAIAQQLLRSPQLLLMDEPFSGLDPETKMKLVELITTISKGNEYLTMVLISHDIKTALQVSDTVYLMGKNRDSAGKLLPGASILHDHTIDLKAQGLAWNGGNHQKLRELLEIELNINRMFGYLSGDDH